MSNTELVRNSVFVSHTIGLKEGTRYDEAKNEGVQTRARHGRFDPALIGK